MNNMKLKTKLLGLLLFLSGGVVSAQSLSALHVEGPFLVNAEGKRVNLHGFAQTFSPWFNEQGTKWTNYDVKGCLDYNKGIIDGILNAGWKMTFVRQHMDPYWSNTPGASSTYGDSWKGRLIFVPSISTVLRSIWMRCSCPWRSMLSLKDCMS